MLILVFSDDVHLVRGDVPLYYEEPMVTSYLKSQDHICWPTLSKVRRRTGGGEWFRGGWRGGVGRPRAARAYDSAGGGWRLRGVEFDDKLEALDFVSSGWKI